MDDERLLVTGGDADTVPPRLRDKTIVQRTGQLMYELSTIYPDVSGLQPAYGWEAPYALTGGGVAVSRRRTGISRITCSRLATRAIASPAAYLASRIFLRNFLDEAEPADEAFAFTR